MDLLERHSTNANRHPWELARADALLGVLSGRPRSTRYADIGAGDLYFSERLGAMTDRPVYAVDIQCEEPGDRGRVIACKHVRDIPPGSIDCVVLMDVIEHVQDDAEFLRGLDRILAPGGAALVTVPAHQVLWSRHDTFLQHRRRYSARQLREALAAGGFAVLECFYFYAVPLAVRAMQTLASKAGLREDRFEGVGGWRYPERHPLTRTMRAILNADFTLSRTLGGAVGCPLGLSLCALCRKTSA